MRLALNYAWDFESIADTIFFGQYKRIDSYFAGTELASSGLPEGKRAGNPGDACATRFRRRSSRRPTPIRSAARRRRRATISAKALRAAQGGRLRAARPPARQRQDRRALHHRAARQRSRASSATCCPISRTSPRSASTLTLRIGRHAAIHRPRAQPRLRHDHHRLGPVAVARQRAAAAIGAAQAADQPSSRNYAGHQEPGRRQADRARDLRQGPRRAGRGDEGARPRAPVESLRDPAVLHRRLPHSRAGTASATRRTSRIYTPGFPDIWW